MKILNIVETAYRATLEEQDDTILWISHALKNAGADLSVLLRSSAVNYAVYGQDASGLKVGSQTLAHPPKLDRDLRQMQEKGVTIYVVEEDLAERGIADEALIPQITKITRHSIPQLLIEFEQVWHW